MCSENKCADQMRSLARSLSARLFSGMQNKQIFSRRGLIILNHILVYGSLTKTYWQ